LCLWYGERCGACQLRVTRELGFKARCKHWCAG
jgi:hypothetical protein